MRVSPHIFYQTDILGTVLLRALQKYYAPVNAGLKCISSERVSDEFRSVNYQYLVCSNYQMETHVRTA